MRDQECLDANRGRRVNNFAQPGMHRNFQVRFLAALRFTLINCEYAVVNVAWSNFHNIAAALSCVQQQRERQPRLAANWVPRFKTSNVIL